MRRKADGSLTLVIVIIIVVFLSWLISFNSRDCHTNADCKNTQYCGSDFSCHDIPVIEKTVESEGTFPAVFIGLSIVAAAIILRWRTG